MTTNQSANIDPFGQSENYEVNNRLNKLWNLDIDDSFADGITYENIRSSCNRSTLPEFRNSTISGNIRYSITTTNFLNNT